MARGKTNYFDRKQLNCTVWVQTNTQTADSTGQLIDSWADSFEIYAGIKTTGGGEFYAAQKLYAQATAVITARYRTDITATNRIRYGTRYFEILGPPNNVDEAGVVLLITAKEVT